MVVELSIDNVKGKQSKVMRDREGRIKDRRYKVQRQRSENEDKIKLRNQKNKAIEIMRVVKMRKMGDERDER